MIRSVSKLYVRILTLFFALAALPLSAVEDERLLSHADCRSMESTVTHHKTANDFSNALLWEIAQDDRPASHIFGTVHVSDPKITTLPPAVKSALLNADKFVMEIIPSAEASQAFAEMIYHEDNNMADYFDAPFIKHINEILGRYQLPAEAVIRIEPWAAFLIMSYPSYNPEPLDLKLLNLTIDNGVETEGLETAIEQTTVFSELQINDQLQLLLDAVCNYDAFEQSLEEMKQLYLKKDLTGLLTLQRRYNYADALYRLLEKRLLTDRNRRMLERMIPMLDEGNVFIAIGALHLGGEHGVLAGLRQRGYTISAIF